METISDSADRTRAVGRLLAAVLVPGDVLCLEGELGTGKTVLVQGIAGGLGFDGRVPSPTFTIIQTFPSVRLCHVDAYRLSGPADLLGAGIDDFLDGEWICAVEWADRVRGALPASCLDVRLLFAEDDARRVIEFDTGEAAAAWGPRLRALEESFER